MENVGTPSRARSLLAEYYNTLPSDWLTDDTNALLGAVVLELQAQRRAGQGPDNLGTFFEQLNDATGFDANLRGDYSSHTLTVKSGGGWETVDPADIGHVVRTADIRAEDDIKVAFADPDQNEKVVAYAASELPVTGLPVETTKVWAALGDNASGTQTDVTIELWSNR